MPLPPPKPVLWSVQIVCRPEDADAIADKLAEVAVSVGVTAMPRQPTAQIDAIYDTEPEASALNAEMALWGALAGIDVGPARVSRIEDLDWLKKVAADFPPLRLGRWVVYGSAHKANVPAHERLKIQIDATSAFGTGEHPTTRGCLEALDHLLRTERPAKLLDMGCGSGILAMAYAKASHGQAVAVDIDPLSVTIARENVRQNGLAAFVQVGYSNGTHSPLVQQGAPYDLLMANIFARPLCEMARALRQLMAPGGKAILSGILTKQAAAVIAAYRAQGFTLVRRNDLGEWSVLALALPSAPS